MIIDLTNMPPEGVYLKGEEPSGVLELKDELFFEEASPVGFDLYVQSVCGELIVRGKVWVEVKTECSRCTDFFSTNVSDSSFLRTFPLTGGEVELDVTEDVREAILLSLPLFPLCDEECKGLCPQCGKNLNKGPCGCTEEEGPSAFDALDGLKL
ncbi:DUF177 domain-containing protein [Verrucomicrobiota bacterium]